MRKATLLKSQFNNRNFTRLKEGCKKKIVLARLRSLRDFARECFCFGSEAVNASGEAVRGLVKSRFHSRLRRLRNPSWAKPGREYGASASARLLTNPASYAGYVLAGRQGFY